ncbi:MAG: hypothetical protein PUC98_08345 [Clostridiales bacterium]|nr:hypothetical protein [Clostridiales bacterium]
MTEQTSIVISDVAIVRKRICDAIFECINDIVKSNMRRLDSCSHTVLISVIALTVTAGRLFLAAYPEKLLGTETAVAVLGLAAAVYCIWKYLKTMSFEYYRVLCEIDDILESFEELEVTDEMAYSLIRTGTVTIKLFDHRSVLVSSRKTRGEKGRAYVPGEEDIRAYLQCTAEV